MKISIILRIICVLFIIILFIFIPFELGKFITPFKYKETDLTYWITGFFLIVIFILIGTFISVVIISFLKNLISWIKHG